MADTTAETPPMTRAVCTCGLEKKPGSKSQLTEIS
jgi:hypothetical protein